MSVDVTWSTTNGGSAISDYVEHEAANGASSTAQTIFLRHNGSNAITGVALYIREFSGTYNGDGTAAADLAELIAWGDESSATAYGGILINWDATNQSGLGAFASANWPTYDDKSKTYGMVHRTGVGDSDENAVTLPVGTGISTAGQIPAGAAPNVRFQMRINVPQDEDTVGIRLFDQVVKYSYTS